MTNIFISYSHLDRRWVDRNDRHNLIPFLADSLRRDGVEIWHDHALVPGDLFRKEIEAKIEQADLAILLVSQHFLNSDFIRDVELPLIERRATAGALHVIPILVGPCDWQELPVVGERHMLPGGPRPLVEFVGHDADWARVQHEILQSVKRQIDRGRGIRIPQKTPLDPATSPAARSNRANRRLVTALIGASIVVAALAVALIPRWQRSAPDSPGVAPSPSRTADPGRGMTATELADLERQIAKYSDQIRSLPFAAAAFQADLKPAAERLWKERSLTPDSARTAAATYRLYAASILMSPTGSTLPGIQSAAPWVRRAVELYPGFGDRAELDAANRFLVDLLINRPSGIEMKALLACEIRIAMIEASQADVDRQVETAFGTIQKLMKQRRP